MARGKQGFAKEEEEGGKQTLDKEGELVNADRERVRPEPAENRSEKKFPLFTKIFSDEDEIALLKGLDVFWVDGKIHNWVEFHHSIKDNLTNKKYSRIQISDKVRKLKKKFGKNFKKIRANGGKIDLSDSHESNVFRLCKALWGDEIGVAEDEQVNKIERKRKQVGEGNEESKGQEQVMEMSQEDFQSEFPLFYASFDYDFRYPNIIKEKCGLIPREKAREVEDKCRNLKAEAIRLELKRFDLVKRDLQRRLEEI